MAGYLELEQKALEFQIPSKKEGYLQVLDFESALQPTP